jgi:hypothetical protein
MGDSLFLCRKRKKLSGDIGLDVEQTCFLREMSGEIRKRKREHRDCCHQGNLLP